MIKSDTLLGTRVNLFGSFRDHSRFVITEMGDGQHVSGSAIHSAHSEYGGAHHALMLASLA